jgi:hypothetical protein
MTSKKTIDDVLAKFLVKASKDAQKDEPWDEAKKELLTALEKLAKDYDLVTHDFGTPQVVAQEKAIPIKALKEYMK